MLGAPRLSFALVLAATILSAQQTLTIPQIAKKVSPCVVIIEGKTVTGDDSFGSGFVVSKDGKIVTNLHVVKNLTAAKVLAPNGDVFDSMTLLATDERRDLAVVKVAGFNLSTVDLGDSDSLAVGQRLIAVGSPLGLEGTVTAGILSAIRKSEGYTVLQTDAAVNPGNSGGPLLNDMGKVIGVIAFKLRATENLNFAIPINYVRGLLANLEVPVEQQALSKSKKSAMDPNDNIARLSLSETLQWLTRTIPLASGVSTGLGLNHFGKVWKLDGCTITVGEVSQSRRPTDNSVISGSSERYTVRLSTVQQGSCIEYGGEDYTDGKPRFRCVFDTSKDGVYFEIVDESSNAEPKVKSAAENYLAYNDYFVLETLDKNTADRMIKIVLHAADLCRENEKQRPF